MRKNFCPDVYFEINFKNKILLLHQGVKSTYVVKNVKYYNIIVSGKILVQS